MITSVEISYYPFVENVDKEVELFLEKLKKYTNLKITINSMSTQIVGEFHEIAELLGKELYECFSSQKSVFVMKISNACGESCSL